MPVIRVDGEVWKALQKRAIPLVDTPNSILRRVLGLELTMPEETPIDHSIPVDNRAKGNKTLDITLNSIHTPRTYALIPVPKSVRRFFPGYKKYFTLETDKGTVETRVTSAPEGTPGGDPDAGSYIQGNLRDWYNQHPNLKAGDRLRFEALEAGKRYKLSRI